MKPDRLQITPGETLEVRERTPAVLLLEAAYAAGGSPPPAHYHPGQDEHFEILEGVLRVEVAGAQRDLGPGDTLEVPRGTSHRMWNPHAQPARARWETRPAGRTEQWFAALAALQGTDHVDADGRPKALSFAALAHEYRDTFRLAATPEPAGRIAVAALDQHRRPAAVGGIARALHRHGRRSRARRALAPAGGADDGRGRPRDRVAGRVCADQPGAHARRRR